MVLDLNKNWRFYKGEYENAWQKDFPDNDWRTVTVPHDWAVEEEFSTKHSSGTGYLPGGTAWYRLRFDLPENVEPDDVCLEFGGVYKNSKVWCNGYYLGRRPNGYINFNYDVSKFIAKKDNVIAVRVSHEDIADSRWYTGSGIIRKVKLHLQNTIAFEYNSIFFTTPKVDEQNAEIEISCNVKNTNENLQNFNVHAELIELSGQKKTVLTMNEAMSLQTLSSGKVVLRGNIENSKLWSTASPSLYDLKLYIKKDNDENVLNETHINVGIRSFEFNPENGFSLNGVSMKLKGVCVHHDAGTLGAAVPKKVWKRRLEKLQEMGCNAIRMSHNPHDPELFDLCDEMGFLVIDEAFDEWEGPKNKWSTGHNVYPPKHQGYSEDFPEWHERDLRALIRRDRNHPSVILWSLGNEIDYPNDPYAHQLFGSMTGNNDANKPEQERIYNSSRPNMERLSVIAKELVEITENEDRTRPATIAAAFPELSSKIGFIDPFKVVGYNYKEKEYDSDHKTFPQKAFYGSENGHHLSAWLEARDKPFIGGQFLWTGIDFLGETSGWPCHGSQAGLLTVAGFEKFTYYYRKALWAEKPVSSIVTARPNKNNKWHDFSEYWNYNDGEDVLVRCYTNELEAELFLNETSLGKMKRTGDEPYVEWTVPFAKGELRVKTTDTETVLCTVHAPSQIVLNKYDDVLKADGEDVMQIEVCIADNKGRNVYTASNMLRVKVSGEAKLLGIENGNLFDNTPYSASYRQVYKGRAIIYIRSTEKAGKANVCVESDMLSTGHIEFNVV